MSERASERSQPARTDRDSTGPRPTIWACRSLRTCFICFIFFFFLYNNRREDGSGVPLPVPCQGRFVRAFVSIVTSERLPLEGRAGHSRSESHARCGGTLAKIGISARLVSAPLCQQAASVSSQLQIAARFHKYTHAETHTHALSASLASTTVGTYGRMGINGR